MARIITHAETVISQLTPLVTDFIQTTDTEKRTEAAFQFGALKSRCEHATRHSPNPGRGEEVIDISSRMNLTIINDLIKTADADQLRNVIHGIEWSIHSHT